MITKKELDELVTDFCHELTHDMSEKQLRTYVCNILYQEKILLRPEDLLKEIEQKYPYLLKTDDRQST